MKRTPLKRKSRPRARKPIRRKARRPSEFARIYGSRKRVRVVKSLPCAICGKEPTKDRPSENHHVKNGGMGRKAGWEWIVPLCSADIVKSEMGCHRELTNMGSVFITGRGFYRNSDLASVAKLLSEILPADGGGE